MYILIKFNVFIDIFLDLDIRFSNGYIKKPNKERDVFSIPLMKKIFLHWLNKLVFEVTFLLSFR